ncbi:MAG: ASCH domain-containing protein [Firmicutes bacterium]|nr:ASCH domain-containing protein [Bacillota bacterium]
MKMKAISIRQPWAHLILCDKKAYEYRSRSTEHRGDLLICSSAMPKVENTVSGHALCVVELTDVFRVNEGNYEMLGLDAPPLPEERLYAWKLENVRAVRPFPVKGNLNFFYVDDALISIVENEENNGEKAQSWYEEYFEPLLYKKDK